MIILSSINCPTVICLPTVCYFSRETPLLKSTAPGSLLYYICLCDMFLFAFIFRYINPKIQKYLAAIFIYLLYLAFLRDLFIQSTTILSRQLDNFWHRYPKGIGNPFNMSGCKYLFFVCRTFYVMLHGSPTGSISLVSSLREIPIVVVLNHPFLFGEIPM